MTRVALKGELGRSERLPMEFEAVDAECLTRILRNRYPEVTIDKLDIVEFIPGHTTKARIAVSYGPGSRSEEHTSELQSLMRNSYAVFCLNNKNTQLTPNYM